MTEKWTVDVILSDDGLQHDAMAAALEIVIVDGERGFGNGYCLPAGPLREPVSRLATCDFVVENERKKSFPVDWAHTQVYSMQLQPQHFVQLTTGKECRLDILTESITGAGFGETKWGYVCQCRCG